jgi:hypothetical protein
MTDILNLTGTSADVFWAEVTPCDHLLQLYGEDDAFLDSLQSFVVAGLARAEAVVVIATRPHRTALESRLQTLGIDLEAGRKQNLYVAYDAHDTLARFMTSGWPDDEKFADVIGEIIRAARGNGRHVRAFGEMVAVLWAEGHSAATVRLEYLWHQLCEAEAFSLLCAYPKVGFTEDIEISLNKIRALHSRVVDFEPPRLNAL